MTALLRNLLGVLILLTSATASLASGQVIVILDASGSMWAQVDGRPKQEIARESLRKALASVPATAEIGFMAYGHSDKASCADIELIVPPAAGTAGAISSAADNLKFLGKTPLTAAVKKAAEALNHRQDSSKIVLITDGTESCAGDPCALGKELEAAGSGLTVDVVGFGLSAEDGKQVACLAQSTGGKYIQAADATALEAALTESVAPAAVAQTAPAASGETAPSSSVSPPVEPAKPEFNFIPAVTLAQGGAPITEGNAWEIYKAVAGGTRGVLVGIEYGAYQGNLDPGEYIVVARDGEAKAEQPLKVEVGQVYKPNLVLNAGTLKLHPRTSVGGDMAGSAAVTVTYPGADIPSTRYGDTSIVVPAGEQKITVTLGSASVDDTVQLAAGQTVEKDIVVGVGHVVANAYYVAGGEKADSSGVGFKIFKAQKASDGTREQVGYGYGSDSKFDLAAGDYVIQATVDLAVAEQPFTVKVGEEQALKVPVNAGVLSINAPGANRIEIFTATTGADGKRKSVGYAYDEKFQPAILAGDYDVVIEKSGGAAPSQKAATVHAGERTEITIQ